MSLPSVFQLPDGKDGLFPGLDDYLTTMKEGPIDRFNASHTA